MKACQEESGIITLYILSVKFYLGAYFYLFYFFLDNIEKEKSLLKSDKGTKIPACNTNFWKTNNHGMGQCRNYLRSRLLFSCTSPDNI